MLILAPVPPLHTLSPPPRPLFRWAHVVCAIWLPETFAEDNVKVEPIAGVAEVSRLKALVTLYLGPPGFLFS